MYINLVSNKRTDIINPGQIAYLPAGGRGAVQQPLLQPRAAVNTVSQQTGNITA